MDFDTLIDDLVNTWGLDVSEDSSDGWRNLFVEVDGELRKVMSVKIDDDGDIIFELNAD